MILLNNHKRDLNEKFKQKILEFDQNMHKKDDIRESLNKNLKTMMLTKREINLLRQEDAFHNRMMGKTNQLYQKAFLLKKQMEMQNTQHQQHN